MDNWGYVLAAYLISIVALLGYALITDLKAKKEEKER